MLPFVSGHGSMCCGFYQCAALQSCSSTSVPRRSAARRSPPSKNISVALLLLRFSASVEFQIASVTFSEIFRYQEMHFTLSVTCILSNRNT
jgi:hypothetical protein